MVVIIEKTKNGLHVEADISSVEEVESMAKKLAGLLPKSTLEKSLLNCRIDVNRKDLFMEAMAYLGCSERFLRELKKQCFRNNETIE